MLVEEPRPWGGLVRLEWVACWFSQRKMIEVVTEIERLQFFFFEGNLFVSLSRIPL